MLIFFMSYKIEETKNIFSIRILKSKGKKNLSKKEQRKIAKEIKTKRIMGFLPFVSSHLDK